ncbi:MAG TPA: hypothetical protein VGO91_10730 [Pyrinomonadaceae bacterium]|jgi:hypothetical protein|nr:hypothetical protein [Pyrinomonadaceae bacterium]
MNKKKAATPKTQIEKSKRPSERELPGVSATSTGCNKVWSGSIGRLRIYDQPDSTGKKVFAYVAPGSNSDYIGYSDDPNVINALFLARDNARSITGYTNANCKIEWLDY